MQNLEINEKEIVIKETDIAPATMHMVCIGHVSLNTT